MKNLIISNTLWNIYNFRFSLIKDLSKISTVVIYCDLKGNNQYLKKFLKMLK